MYLVFCFNFQGLQVILSAVFLPLTQNSKFGYKYIFISKLNASCCFSQTGKVREKFPLEMAEIQASVVAADVNDDGKIELVTSDAHGNVAVWTPKGDLVWEKHLKSLIPQVTCYPNFPYHLKECCMIFCLVCCQIYSCLQSN